MLYTNEGATSHIQLSQLDMAELFHSSKQNIAKRLKAIFADVNLQADSVVNHWLATAAYGKSCRVAQ